MSCSRLVAVSRSRCSKPTSAAIRSAACCVASACRRKRSGAASHTLERSKKSNVRRRPARPCTVCGVSSSTAATTSAVATCSLETTEISRSRDSASAGNASSASNASVRRRPWPSFWWRSAGAGTAALAPLLAGDGACDGDRDGAGLLALAPLVEREDGLRALGFAVVLDFGLLAVFGFDFDAVAFMFGKPGTRPSVSVAPYPYRHVAEKL